MKDKTVLLIGAGLFLRSLSSLEDTPLGFHPEGVLSFHVGASFDERPDATLARHQRIMNALAAAPEDRRLPASDHRHAARTHHYPVHRLSPGQASARAVDASPRVPRSSGATPSRAAPTCRARVSSCSPRAPWCATGTGARRT